MVNNKILTGAVYRIPHVFGNSLTKLSDHFAAVASRQTRDVDPMAG